MGCTFHFLKKVFFWNTLMFHPEVTSAQLWAWYSASVAGEGGVVMVSHLQDQLHFDSSPIGGRFAWRSSIKFQNLDSPSSPSATSTSLISPKSQIIRRSGGGRVGVGESKKMRILGKLKIEYSNVDRGIYGCRFLEFQIETCMCCTLYFVYVLKICTTREMCSG